MSRRPVALGSIRLLVLDVDGVLTDGRLYYGPDGEAQKVFHVRDGGGIKAVMALGVQVAVISGRTSAACAARCTELGITEVWQGVDDKAVVLAALCRRLGISPRQCACVGDDAPDLPLLAIAGLAVAVADAHPEARRAAHRCTVLAGGHGAVREVCDWLLAARRPRLPR
jgi:3-deoxy-D-manno-octulosonate 8-phosphate phosphatase (KDO 8-P phosphatase)